jgi:hypothetical protein
MTRKFKIGLAFILVLYCGWDKLICNAKILEGSLTTSQKEKKRTYFKEDVVWKKRARESLRFLHF